MKIAILGYDIEGKASYEHFARGDNQITICDRNPDVEVPEGVDSVLGDSYLDDLDRFDLIVRTAGLPPRLILEKNPNVADKITSHINEFLRVSLTKNIIGVTGTKGKGTTSALITNMLEATGHATHLGGNIGLPPLYFLSELNEDAWVVLELSSFQLIDMQTSPHIGVCVLVVPEHLDWHADMDEYTQAKTQLFAHQSKDDIAIYFADNEASKEIASVSPGRKIPYFTSPGAHVDGDTIKIDRHEICKTTELKLLGKHNWQNVCAAITAVWQVTQDTEKMREVLTHFTGLPNRIEFVKNVDGVDYYNDSFSTGLHSTVAAIEAINSKKVLILGGYDRHLDIDFFGPFIKSHGDEFRSILLIGQVAEKLAETLQKNNYTNFVVDTDSKTMPEIVTKAKQLAQPGDAVILSPGFASFDMFKNFEERGTQFRDIVNGL